MRRGIGAAGIGTWLVLMVAAGASAQGIWTDQSDLGFNNFGSGSPESDDISNNGDLFVRYDVEVGDVLYLNRRIYMHASDSGANDDQTIYFYRYFNRTYENFRWDESEGGFSFTDDVYLAPGGENVTVRVEALTEGKLALQSESNFQYYLIDSDGDDTAGQFEWWQDNRSNASNQMMQLQTSAGGDLFIGGSLATDHWDLAEAFWMSEPVGPGELVALDPGRSGAVRRAAAKDPRAAIGVVSSEPAVTLGAVAFSFERLRQSWGPEIADEAESAMPELRRQVLEADAELAAEAARMDSYSTYAAQAREARRLAVEEEGRNAEPDDGEPSGDGTERSETLLSEEELASEYEISRAAFEASLETRMLQRFMATRFAPVALAGRVPVRVDAGYGAIRPGDLLTVSPTAGVAMKAAGAGTVVGAALEGLASGTGTIQMLVQRGWYGGGGVGLTQNAAGLCPPGSRVGGEPAVAAAAVGDARVERLEARVIELEGLVRRLMGEPGLGDRILAAR